MATNITLVGVIINLFLFVAVLNILKQSVKGSKKSSKVSKEVSRKLRYIQELSDSVASQYERIQVCLKVMECLEIYNESDMWEDKNSPPDADCVLRAEMFIFWMFNKFDTLKSDDICVFPTLDGGINISYNSDITSFEIQLNPETEKIKLSWKLAGKLDSSGVFTESETRDQMVNMLTSGQI